MTVMVRRFRNRDGPSWDIDRRCLDPLAQVRETEEKVIITVDLPFVKKEDIEVTVEENSLKIRAGTKKDIQFEKWGGVHRKISFNSFRKNVKLPAQVNPDKSKATFKNGVLEVRLEKTEGKEVEIE